MVLDRFNGREDVTLLTGGPVKNLHKVIQMRPNWTVGRWVGQGGFAGSNVISEELQLPKFRGLETCASFNPNGDPKGWAKALEHPFDRGRFLVSKNVCHGVAYDHNMHQAFAAQAPKSKSLDLVHFAMSQYLEERPEGKLFHDPLAMACALDPLVGSWIEGVSYREKGKYGFRKQDGTNTFAIESYDHERFISVLLAH